MTHVTPTANPRAAAPARGLAAAPSLTVLSDQPERWTALGKNPITFDEARERVAAADAADGHRHDLGIGDLSAYVVVPLGAVPSDYDVARGDHPATSACLATVRVPGRRDRAWPMRRAAFGQLAETIGAPPKYLLGLPPQLATACVSVGLQRLDERSGSKLMRLAGGEARSLVSDRYAPLDNDLVLDTVETTLRGMGMLRDVRITDLAVGPTLSMRIVLPGEAAPVKAGDVIQHGLDVLNGEVGNRSVSIAPVTYRLVCTNGMRRWDAGATKRWNHVGDPQRLRDAFRDAVPVALADARGLRERMASAVDQLIDDALGEIEGLSAFGFGVGETRAIARDLFADRGLALPSSTDAWADTVRAAALPVSVYDVANAITHVAQSRSGVDERLSYEEAGGAYLLRRTR